jgi:hypothetical protein
MIETIEKSNALNEAKIKQGEMTALKMLSDASIEIG